MNSATEDAVFMNTPPDRKSNASRCVPASALVVSGQRTILAVHCKLPDHYVTVCSTLHPVLWTGILKVDGRFLVVVVSKGTTITFGKERYSGEDSKLIRTKAHHCDRLLWSTKSLPVAPIACSAYQNMLLISDGASSWLCHISFSENNEINLKNSNLCINGIIRITSEDKIIMLSCDGRKYSCTWEYLCSKKETGSWKTSVDVNDSQQLKTVDDLMKVIEKCSRTISMEGKIIQRLVLYIKQFSLAQRLLTDRKHIFHPVVKIEKSIEKKGFLAILQLSKIENDVALRGSWWVLCTVISGVTRKSVSNTKLTEKLLRSAVVQTKLVLPYIDFPITSKHIDIQVYLVLESFSTNQPLFRVLACQAEVDILNFLESECTLTRCSSRLNFGIVKVINSSKTSVINTNVKKEPVPSCNLSISIINSNKTLNLVSRLLNITLNNNVDEEMTVTNGSTLWYMDDRIDMTCDEKDKILTLKLKSSNSFVILTLKAALERRVKELKQCSATVSLASSLLREAQYAYRLLNYEENYTSIVNTVSHLYNAIVMLISLIPLC